MQKLCNWNTIPKENAAFGWMGSCFITDATKERVCLVMGKYDRGALGSSHWELAGMDYLRIDNLPHTG